MCEVTVSARENIFLRRPTRKGNLCYCECAGKEESKGKLYKIHNKRRGENRNRSRFLPFVQAGIVNSKAKRRFFNVKRSKWIGLQSSRSMLMLHFTHFHTSFEKDFYTFLLLPFRHMGSGSLRSNFLYYVQYFFPFSLPSTLSVWAYPAIRFPSSHLWLFLHDQKPGWRRRKEGGQNNNRHTSPLSCAFHMPPIFVWLVEREMIAAARILKSFRSSQKCRSKRTCWQWIGSSQNGKRRGFQSLEATKISVVSLNVRRIPSHM